MNMEHTQVADLKSILKNLQSTDSQILRDAAFAAADAHLAESVNLLCGLLLNPNVGVQEAAEFALRKLRGKNAVHGLIPLVRGNDVTIRNIAMDILREIANDDLEYIKQFMHDEDENIRIYITDILGHTGNRMAVEILASTLIKDTNVNVRYHAAVSLGLLAFPECIKPLAKAMKDEEWVQFAAVEALTHVNDKSTIDTLVKLLPTSTELVASTIIIAIGESGDIKTIPLLFKFLEKASTPLRRKAVRAIIQILGEKSLSLLSQKDQSRLKVYLLDALGDEDESIQLAALSGLAVMGDEKVTNKILQFAVHFEASDDTENIMRNAAIYCIAKIGFNDCFLENLKTNDDKLLSLLIEVSSVMNDRKCIEEIKDFFWSKNVKMQRLIAKHLAKVGIKEDLDFFMDILENHDDDHIIKETIIFLGSYSECIKCADIIFKMLAHPYDDIKEAALIACINMASPKLKLKFKELYKSSDVTQRIIAVYALYNFDPENIAEEVRAALHDTDPKLRQLAVQCLGSDSKNLKHYLSDILECLNDKDSNVRIAIIEIIGKSDDSKAAVHLIKALDDESEWVKIRAIEALGQLKEPSAIPTMVQMLENTTPMLTLAIINSIGVIGGNVAFIALLNMMGQDDKEIQNAIENAIATIRSNGENA